MAMIRLEQLSFGYHHKAVLENISLSIDEGGVMALLGPNGSGKTTLLKLVLGLLKPSCGSVFLNARNIKAIPHKELAHLVAYVPQIHKETFGYRLFDVVLMGRMPHKPFFSRYGEEDRRIAHDALDKLGIADLAERPYTEVSGGERQLALIARAMAQGARIVVMDEPTNGLDYGNQVRLLERLKKLSREGFTFVFSTHHPDHAMSVADRVVMMLDGRILYDGPAEETVTSSSLKELYGVDVRLFSVEENVHVCVPAVRLCRCKKNL
ncbi:MAG: ABC transporter ATP-binding protein [Desulfuromonadaceae bacterium]|nr:ABC transporter ATP-binding protein [Desulfuromonadaceae bacterium]